MAKPPQLQDGTCVVCEGSFTQPHMGRRRRCCYSRECSRRRSQSREVVALLGDLTAECECGQPRHPKAEACARCLWLDGSGPERSLVSALRVLGEMATLDALTGELDCTERTVYRGLARLRVLGRVVAVNMGPRSEEFVDPKTLRYVPAPSDERNNPMATGSRRNGYYVHVPPRDRSPFMHGDGSPALYVLKNTRRTG